MTKTRKKLIEVALPLEAINKAAAYEKMPGIGPHPRGIHLWWARRPLAAARAVIFAQMVDDPASCPEDFPTPEAQERERQRLFKLLEELVQWENTTNEAVLARARDEIWKSWRRACRERREWREARSESWTPEQIARDEALFDPDKLPAFHDPFAGGGALPLEAQRLGLEAWASDLNPVAVLINKAMIEIPPRFAGKPPVNPKARSEWREERSEWREERSEWREERSEWRGVRSEIGERDALSGNDPLAEGDGSSTGSLSTGCAFATRGNLRDAVSNHSRSGIDSSEHRGGMDTRNGQGQSALSGDCTGIACGNGNTTDTLRGSEVVFSAGNESPAQSPGRSEPNADHNAPEASQSLSSHSSLLSPHFSLLSPHSSLLFPRSYKGAQGLAEDVRHYGQWMRDEAEKRIGHLYPKVTAWFDPLSGQYFGEADVEAWRRSEERGERSESGEQTARECGHTSLSSLLSTLSSRQLTVIAWLWARTVKSPNPAFAHVEVPLASTFMLSTKPGKEA